MKRETAGKGILLVVVLLTAGTVALSRGTDPGLFTFRIEGDEVILEEYQYGDFVDVTIPATYEGYPITRIDEFSFGQCRGMLTLSIPSTVREIDPTAFYQFRDLIAFGVYGEDPHYVVINWALYKLNPLTLIRNPPSIQGGMSTHVYVPETVVGIEKYAFRYCDQLTDIHLPESMWSIGVGAFDSCESLESFHVHPDNINFTDIDGVLHTKDHGILIKHPQAVQGVHAVAQGVTHIYDGAFRESRISEVIMSDAVQRIGFGAFSVCDNLVSIDLSAGLEYIGIAAFVFCTKLEQVAIPPKVESIKVQTFSGCTRLSRIEFPANLREIEPLAFVACESLEEVFLPFGLRILDRRAFEDCDQLRNLYFLGDRPGDLDSLSEVPLLKSIHYAPGAKAWGPTYAGLPTRIFYPGIQFMLKELDSRWSLISGRLHYQTFMTNWIHLDGCGFRYAYDTKTEGTYLFNPTDRTWSWTCTPLYPWVYSFGTRSWRMDPAR